MLTHLYCLSSRALFLALVLTLWASIVLPLRALPQELPDPAKVTVEPGHVRIAHRFRQEIRAVTPWIEKYGNAAVFGAVFLEGVGIPAPGLTLLVAGAVLAASGRGPAISPLLASAFAAAVLGNTLGFAVGRLGGRPLLRWFRVEDKRLERLEKAFSSYGGWFIVAARFFDGLKQLNGLAAGVLGMPLGVFSAFNVAGAVLWVALFGLGTYAVDEHLHQVRRILRHANLWVAAGTAALALAVLWFLRKKIRPSPEQEKR